MKIYILNTGYLETDKNNVEACATIGTLSSPKVENDWIKLPVLSFLIETEGEYILYDVGSHPDAMKRLLAKTSAGNLPFIPKRRGKTGEPISALRRKA